LTLHEGGPGGFSRVPGSCRGTPASGAGESSGGAATLTGRGCLSQQSTAAARTRRRGPIGPVGTEAFPAPNH